MRARNRKPQSYWAGLVAKFSESGVSREVFCREQGVALSTFENWRRKLKAAAAAGTDLPARFVEVCLPDPADGEFRHVVAERSSELVVELPFGVVLRFYGVPR